MSAWTAPGPARSAPSAGRSEERRQAGRGPGADPGPRAAAPLRVQRGDRPGPLAERRRGQADDDAAPAVRARRPARRPTLVRQRGDAGSPRPHRPLRAALVPGGRAPPTSPGTRLVTVAGAVRQPGVYEVESGDARWATSCPLAGARRRRRRAHRRLSSGPGIDVADVARAAADARPACGPAGVPGAPACCSRCPPGSCGLAETARILGVPGPRRARSSAGRAGSGCPPSRMTSPSSPPGGRTGDLLERLGRRLGVISGRGACRHPGRRRPHGRLGHERLRRRRPRARGRSPVPGRRHAAGARHAALRWPRDPAGAGHDAARLRVDPTACAGHGLCADLLAERIGLDEWGFPIVFGDVPPSLAAHARRAGPGLPRPGPQADPRPAGRPRAGAARQARPIGRHLSPVALTSRAPCCSANECGTSSDLPGDVTQVRLNAGPE